MAKTIRTGAGFRRKIGNFWYTSEHKDVHYRKAVVQDKARLLRSIGRKCVIVPVKDGFRLFQRR